MTTYGGAPLTPEEVAALRARAVREGWMHVRLVELDQFLNGMLFNGMPDETMSSHWQRLADSGNPLAKAAIAALDVIQKRHGQTAQAGDIARADRVEQTEDKSLGTT